MEPSGEKVTLGGKTYTVSALTFRQLGEGRAADIGAVQQAIQAGKVFEPEHTEPMARLLAASLRRAHPDITEDECMDLLDLDNFRGLFQTILGLSGLMRENKKGGEHKAAGG